MEYTYIHNHQSQFIEMFEGDKYPHEALDSIAADWLKGQSFKKDEIKESGIHSCIHYGELFTKYGPVISQVQSYTSSEPKRLSKSGDILFPASDVTPNGLARCSMLPFDDVILGGDIIILRPKEDFNSGFLSYAINNQTSQLLTRVNGGVVKHMSSKSLKSVLIPIPPMDKQEEYIGIAHQADKSKFDGFKSQFIEMFGDMKYLTSDKTMSDFFDMKAGQSITAENIIATYDLELFPCYGGNGLRGYVTHYTHEGHYCLIGRQGALCGNVNLTDGKFFATEHAIVVTPKISINTYWLFFALSEMNLNRFARGVAQPGLSVKQLETIPFSIPPTEEQEQFERLYRQADKSKYYEINET